MLLLTRRQRETQVTKLAEEGKTTRQIAKALHISLKEIGRILRKARGEEYFEEGATITSMAFQLFKDGKRPLDVSIKLNLSADTTLDIFKDYLRLSNSGEFIKIYQEFKNEIPLLLCLYNNLKANELNTIKYIQELMDEFSNLTLLRLESKELTEYLINLNKRRYELEDELKVKGQLLFKSNIHPGLQHW
jgi:hypothetical protein